MFQANQKKEKRGKKNKIKGKQRKLGQKEWKLTAKKIIETIAPQQESHDATEPIGPLFLHYQGISGLLKTQRPYIQYAFEKGCSPMNHRTLSSNIYAST